MTEMGELQEIKYTKGWKYQLAETISVKTPVLWHHIVNDYFELFPDGTLTIFKGYAWDGASGPTWDTKSSIAPSAVHDVFCQCMRSGEIEYNLWQDIINKFFKDHCIACGMVELRAKAWHLGVEIGDAGNPAQGPDREILSAPAGIEKDGYLRRK